MQAKLDTLTRLVHGLIKESEPQAELPDNIRLPLSTQEQLVSLEEKINNDQTVRAVLVKNSLLLVYCVIN